MSRHLIYRDKAIYVSMVDIFTIAEKRFKQDKVIRVYIICYYQ